MIEKMSFVSVVGPINDIDRVVEKYISRYEIYFEYAISKLKSAGELRPIVAHNPYKQQMGYIDGIYNAVDEKTLFIHAGAVHESGHEAPTVLEASDTLKEVHDMILSSAEKVEELHKKSKKLRNTIDRMKPFTGIGAEIEKVFNFKYLEYSFGRIPIELYGKFHSYVHDTIETVFIECDSDDNYVWGVYFSAKSEKAKIDAAMTALNFERVEIPKELCGAFSSEYEKIVHEYDEIQNDIEAVGDSMKEQILSRADRIIRATVVIKQCSLNFDVRKYAACTKQNGSEHYILCGWMATADAGRLWKEIDGNETETVCINDEAHELPPTKLKNPAIFRPFEMFVKMYGLPAYNEFDPTIFVGLTYALIFGAMFGDVGQGFVLMVGGFLLYKIKKMNLAAIISCAGLFSMIFGFMFGSIFGFEGKPIKPIWNSPLKEMATLPFVGRLNTVFVVSIVFGMLLIMVTMVINIRNALKSKDTERAWFDTNGLAGLIFYASLTAVLLLFIAEKPLPAGIVLAVMFGLPLLVVALKEPLTHIADKRAKILPESKGMFFVQTVFEMFEVLLSYFSNTLSFVRIGAFAISHAAIMEVVLQLAGAEGTPNIPGLIAGNLFVCGFEGLIVGIQVLRLEYYELFSRFYKGTGRSFTPYNK